jgi:hypothetical protein
MGCLTMRVKTLLPTQSGAIIPVSTYLKYLMTSYYLGLMFRAENDILFEELKAMDKPSAASAATVFLKEGISHFINIISSTIRQLLAVSQEYCGRC